MHGLSNFNYYNQSGACEYLLYRVAGERVCRSDKVDGGKGIKGTGRGRLKEKVGSTLPSLGI